VTLAIVLAKVTLTDRRASMMNEKKAEPPTSSVLLNSRMVSVTSIGVGPIGRLVPHAAGVQSSRSSSAADAMRRGTENMEDLENMEVIGAGRC
jgi:hypothetical protein